MRNEKFGPELPLDGAAVAPFRPDRNRNPPFRNWEPSSTSSPDALALYSLVSSGCCCCCCRFRPEEPLFVPLSSSVASSSFDEEEKEEEEAVEEEELKSEEAGLPLPAASARRCRG